MQEETGPQNVNECGYSIEFFLCLFDEKIIEHIVEQTNLYTTQSGRRYDPTNITEMKIFIVLNLLMGVKSTPSYRDCW